MGRKIQSNDAVYFKYKYPPVGINSHVDETRSLLCDYCRHSPPVSRFLA